MKLIHQFLYEESRHSFRFSLVSIQKKLFLDLNCAWICLIPFSCPFIKSVIAIKCKCEYEINHLIVGNCSKCCRSTHECRAKYSENLSDECVRTNHRVTGNHACFILVILNCITIYQLIFLLFFFSLTLIRWIFHWRKKGSLRINIFIINCSCSFLANWRPGPLSFYVINCVFIVPRDVR